MQGGTRRSRVYGAVRDGGRFQLFAVGPPATFSNFSAGGPMGNLEPTRTVP